MNEMLRKRMSATQQASEQQAGDAAYEQIFQMPVLQTEAQFYTHSIPLTSAFTPTLAPNWKPLRMN